MTRAAHENKATVAASGAPDETPAAASPPPAFADDDDVLWADVMLMIPRPHRSKVLTQLCRNAHEVDELSAENERLRKCLASRARSGDRDPLDERDDLIRGMRTHYGKRSANGAATALAKEWEEYLSNGWSRERAAPTLPKASAHRRALHRISKLNGGAALSARQLISIFDGLRDS